MAYAKNSVSKYQLTGGVNQKASQYSTATSQVLNLRNLDFFVPNALQKTPGSTQAIASSFNNPIQGLFEFSKLNGESFLLTGASGNVYARSTGSAFSVLDSGFGLSTALDFLTFVDRAWVASGVKAGSYDGSRFFVYGLQSPQSRMSDFQALDGYTPLFTVMNVTVGTYNTNSQRAFLIAAYNYVRADGYESPLQPEITGAIITPRNTDPSLNWVRASFHNSFPPNLGVGGMTNLGVPGATAINLYLAFEQFTGNGGGEIVDAATSAVGGFRVRQTTIDPSNFYLLTTIPLGTTTYAFTLTTSSWSLWTSGRASGQSSAPVRYGSIDRTNFNYFATFTPRFLELNNNRVFSAGFSAAPSTVWFSNVGLPEVFEQESFFEARTNDGDVITGLKTFQNQLLVFKRESFYKLIGTDESNYQLVEISTEYGCVNNRAIAEYQNFLLFLDQEGVIQYNGANFQIISLPIEPIIQRMNVSAAFETAVAIHYVERNQIWFGIPIDGSSQNNITLIYDYILGAWTFVDGFNPTVFAQVKQSLNKRTVWYGDYSGLIHYFSPSFLSHNGRAFTCLIETGFDAPDGADVQNMFRRLFLDVNRVSGVTGQISVQVLSDYDNQTVRATMAIFQNSFQTRADFGVGARAIGFRMSHANVSCPFLLNGYTVQRRFLRKV